MALVSASGLFDDVPIREHAAAFGEAARNRETIHRVNAYHDRGATCRAAGWSAS